MPDKEDKERKKLVVEEVESPVKDEMVSSSDLQKEESSEKIGAEDEVSDEQAADETVKEEVPESPSKEMEKEIHEEESHLHDIHTNMHKDMESVGEGREPVSVKKPGNPVLWILVPGIFLLGALLGGIVFYQRGISSGEPKASPSASPAAMNEMTPAPSATPMSEANLAKYPIMVENGSGIPGAAGQAKTLLTGDGFSVSSTGNADNYNYSSTVIEVKSDVPDAFVSQLTDTLSKSYKMDKTQSLPDSSTYEVIVVVGSDSAK